MNRYDHQEFLRKRLATFIDRGDPLTDSEYTTPQKLDRIIRCTI